MPTARRGQVLSGLPKRFVHEAFGPRQTGREATAHEIKGPSRPRS